MMPESDKPKSEDLFVLGRKRGENMSSLKTVFDLTEKRREEHRAKLKTLGYRKIEDKQVKFFSGREYEIQSNGSWRRVK